MCDLIYKPRACKGKSRGIIKALESCVLVQIMTSVSFQVKVGIMILKCGCLHIYTHTCLSDIYDSCKIWLEIVIYYSAQTKSGRSRGEFLPISNRNGAKRSGVAGKNSGCFDGDLKKVL